MSQTFFLGQLRLIGVAVIAYAFGKGWLSSDAMGLLTQIGTPLGLLFGPWIWSLYVNFDKKLVPQDSVAISRGDVVGAVAKGATVGVPADTVKVVG